jgi:hypothetical protein
VYARDVGGRTLTFGVSGLLWNRSLVMYDEETGSLWSHILGEAKQGPLRGKRLEQVPSVMTDWKTWGREHADGTVVLLSRTSEEYRTAFYRQPKQFVLGIAEGGKAKAWGFDRLAKAPALNDTFDGRPVAVLFDRDSMTARLYGRNVKGRELTFEGRAGRIKDRETGSTWEPATGRAVDGPLQGSYLQALPAVVSYRKTWQTFHPKSQ